MGLRSEDLEFASAEISWAPQTERQMKNKWTSPILITPDTVSKQKMHVYKVTPTVYKHCTLNILQNGINLKHSRTKIGQRIQLSRQQNSAQMNPRVAELYETNQK